MSYCCWPRTSSATPWACSDLHRLRFTRTPRKRWLHPFQQSISSKETAGPFHIKWCGSWQYSAGSSKDLSQFWFFTTNKRRYRITAVKIDGEWHIDWQFHHPGTGGVERALNRLHTEKCRRKSSCFDSIKKQILNLSPTPNAPAAARCWL